MDILAHGLWTNAVFESAAQAKKRKRSRKDTWIAVFFGVAPDLFSFGIFFVINLFTTGTLWPYAQARIKSELAELAQNSAIISDNLIKAPAGPPDPSLIPSYVYTLYDFTHSLVIFAGIFLVLWLLRGRPYWLIGGWGLHIVTDVFSHSDKFFPTPLLFPFSETHVNGISWADPIFMVVNYSFLIAVYLWLYKFRKRPEVRYTESPNA
ncbi:hypothetical protein C4571_03430 [Candidatus Parcubacteria bacterium]|nr:MAG: hypothetical protein C4571_03430 [Candidatus Parcubacteria bacterium]